MKKIDKLFKNMQETIEDTQIKVGTCQHLLEEMIENNKAQTKINQMMLETLEKMLGDNDES